MPNIEFIIQGQTFVEGNSSLLKFNVLLALFLKITKKAYFNEEIGFA